MGVEIACCMQDCGAAFALADALYQRLRASGGTFYCPMGHPQNFTKTVDERDHRIKTLETNLKFREQAADKCWTRLNDANGEKRKLWFALRSFIASRGRGVTKTSAGYLWVGTCGKAASKLTAKEPEARARLNAHEKKHGCRGV